MQILSSALGQESFWSEMLVGGQPVDGGALFPVLDPIQVILRLSCNPIVIQPI